MKVELPEDLVPDDVTAYSMEAKRLRRLRRQAHQHVSEVQESAIREAFRKLHEQGVIDTPPEEIPRQAADGLSSFAEQLPADVASLIQSGRLVHVSQSGRHTPRGIIVRGWLVFDNDRDHYDIPPEGTLSSYCVRHSSTRDR